MTQKCDTGLKWVKLCNWHEGHPLISSKHNYLIPWWYVIPGSSDFRYINSQDFIKKTNFDFFFLNKHTKINKQSYKFTIKDFQRSPETHVKVNLFLYFRSSQQRCSLRKGIFRNFAKLTRKHLCQSLFFNKVADLRPATLLKKKKLLHRCFPVNFAKFLRTLFLQNTSERLLLLLENDR